jgi:hypothetical protein
MGLGSTKQPPHCLAVKDFMAFKKYEDIQNLILTDGKKRILHFFASNHS